MHVAGNPIAASASFSKFRRSVVSVAPRPRARQARRMFCTAGNTDDPVFLGPGAQGTTQTGASWK